MLTAYARLYEPFDGGGALGGARARERTGDIRTDIEAGARGHFPAADQPPFPEAHIAGAPGVAMAPAIPARRFDERELLMRVGRAAGRCAAAAVRFYRKAPNASNVPNLRGEDLSRKAGDFIVEHPWCLLGAVVAGFVLGKIVKR